MISATFDPVIDLINSTYFKRYPVWKVEEEGHLKSCRDFH